MAQQITKQIANFLTQFTDEAVQGMTPVHFKDAEFPDFLHISRNPNLREMTPRISPRQANKEDTSVPRMVGAPTLFGCMIGYYSILHDYENMDKEGKQNLEHDWLSGYYIYETAYEWRFHPNEKMVNDVAESGEVWLLGYDPLKKVAKMRPIGKLFAVSGTMDFTKPVKSANFSSTLTFYVEIDKPEGIHLSKNYKLAKGFWKVTIPFVKELNHISTAWDRDEGVSVQQIQAGDYYSAKNLVADMLEHPTIRKNPFQF